MCLAPASVNLAESRTPGLLSVILPPAEVLVMPGDKLERIEEERKNRWCEVERSTDWLKKENMSQNSLSESFVDSRGPAFEPGLSKP